MKQVVQYKRNGRIAVLDVPSPSVSRGSVKIDTIASLISVGTERSTQELAEKSLAGKAMARPDLVRKVIDTARKEGLWSTVEKVRTRLNEAGAVGYSVVGRVSEIGAEVTTVAPGERVAAGGVGHASHAAQCVIPHLLTARVPDEVDSEDAAFTTIGAIALQGVRLAEPRIGETFLVIGLGLVGQLTVQILRANGCRVLAFDLNEDMIARAEAHGAVGLRDGGDLTGGVLSRTDGMGADGSIITAATESDVPVTVAGHATRDKGRVIVVGAVGLTLPREPYYAKEIDFKISRSYGPGRYDHRYEEEGHDYPYGYVRFTEQRNMQAFLGLLAEGKVRVKELITHRFPAVEAEKAYAAIRSDASSPALGVVITYGDEDRVELSPSPSRRRSEGRIGVSFIGAGNYATARLLPPLRKFADVSLQGVCTQTGLRARDVADRYGFATAAATPEELIADDSTDCVFVCTRHDSHAALVVAALEAGKHVFTEKPLCLTWDEWHRLGEVFATARTHAMVGYNRRYSPFTRRMREFLGVDPTVPSVVHIRVNAGEIDRNHWIQDPRVGGGRILGEVCHFIDLAMYLSGSTPVDVTAHGFTDPQTPPLLCDNVVIGMAMENGSVASIAYTAKGGGRMPKEHIEMFKGGRSARIDDFTAVTLFDSGRRKRHSAFGQDKGQAEMLRRFIASLGSDTPLIAPDDLLAGAAAALKAVDALCRDR